MLNDNQLLKVYRFNDYWKDVGTIKSLWEANQDLIGEEPLFDLYNPLEFIIDYRVRDISEYLKFCFLSFFCCFTK